MKPRDLEIELKEENYDRIHQLYKDWIDPSCWMYFKQKCSCRCSIWDMYNKLVADWIIKADR